MDAPRTLLLSLAHPDDESFLAGGTIARYARDGRTRVVLLTATRGGAATMHEDAVFTRGELTMVRASELDRAARLLGVHESIVLKHEDGRLGATDVPTLRRELVEAIRRHRPTVVITFDPHGGNLHPDHMAISRFTTDAVAAAADDRWLPGAGAAHRVDRVLWTTPQPAWALLRKRTPDQLCECAGVDYVVDATAFLDLKRDALRTHASQRAGIERLFFGEDSDRVLAAEAFRHGFGPPPPSRPAADLFAGLVE